MSEVNHRRNGRKYSTKTSRKFDISWWVRRLNHHRRRREENMQPGIFYMIMADVWWVNPPTAEHDAEGGSKIVDLADAEALLSILATQWQYAGYGDTEGPVIVCDNLPEYRPIGNLRWYECLDKPYGLSDQEWNMMNNPFQIIG